MTGDDSRIQQNENGEAEVRVVPVAKLRQLMNKMKTLKEENETLKETLAKHSSTDMAGASEETDLLGFDAPKDDSNSHEVPQPLSGLTDITKKLGRLQEKCSNLETVVESKTKEVSELKQRILSYEAEKSERQNALICVETQTRSDAVITPAKEKDQIGDSVDSHHKRGVESDSVPGSMGASDYREENENLRKMLETANQQLSDQTTEAEKMKQALKALHMTKKDSHEKEKEVWERMEQLLEEKAELKELIKQKDVEISSFMTRFKALNEKLEALKAMTVKWKDIRTKLIAAAMLEVRRSIQHSESCFVDVVKPRMKTLLSCLHHLSSELSTANTKLSHFKERSMKEKHRIKKLVKENHEFAQKLNGSLKESDSFMSKLEGNDKEIKELKGKLAQMNASKKEVEAKHESLLQTCSLLREERKSMTKELEQLTQVRVENDVANEHEVSKLYAQVKSLEGEVRKKRADQEQQKELVKTNARKWQAIIAQKEKLVTESRSEASTLRDEVQRLSGKEQAFQNRSEELEKLTKKLVTLEQENTGYRNAQQQFIVKLTAVKTQVLGSMRGMQDLRDTFHTSTQAIDGMFQQVATGVKEIVQKEHMEVQETLRRALTLKMTQLGETEHAHQLLGAELGSLKDKQHLFENEEGQILQYAQEQCRREGKIKLMEDQLQELSNQIKVNKAEIERVTQQKQELAARNDSLVYSLQVYQHDDQSFFNFEYLKNIIISFCRSSTAEEKIQLFTVLATMLKFTTQEVAETKTIIKEKSHILSFMNRGAVKPMALSAVSTKEQD